ncbi:MAG: copper chaperone PCu(A)C [Actinomycetales bacterium]|nr:copper chaperone PCu(A)C [Actinomycetales bacterium]
MSKSIRAVISAAVLSGALAVSALATAPAASAAQHAAWTPKPGKACGTSGTARIIQGKAYWCVSATEGATPRWGKGVSTSTSPLTIADGWAKAADSGMSAAFGMIKNPTDRPIRVVAAISPDSTVLQLHEVVDKDGTMVMQQKTGGFVIPAKGMVELKPGGSHIMFMKVTKPIPAGTMVPITLITADGGLLKATVLGKVFNGANESYTGGSSGSSMSGM